jgi:hypothetical protein
MYKNMANEVSAAGAGKGKTSSNALFFVRPKGPRKMWAKTFSAVG